MLMSTLYHVTHPLFLTRWPLINHLRCGILSGISFILCPPAYYVFYASFTMCLPLTWFLLYLEFYICYLPAGFTGAESQCYASPRQIELKLKWCLLSQLSLSSILFTSSATMPFFLFLLPHRSVFLNLALCHISHFYNPLPFSALLKPFTSCCSLLLFSLLLTSYSLLWMPFTTFMTLDVLYHVHDF